MNVKIRPASLNDSDELFALVRDFATSFRPERQAFEKSLKQLIADESAYLTAAAVGNEIVGYCLGFDHFAFYANGRVSWVEEITVREDLRGKGIGRKLMADFEEWSLGRKSKLVGLATRRAASFYEALGYENSAVFYRKLLSG